MTIQWTTEDIPFGAGIDTKTDRHLLQPPKVADLSDAIFPATGLSGYETRPGYDKIASVGALPSALFTRANELCAIANDTLYAVSTQAVVSNVTSKGNLLAVKVEQSTLDTQASNQTFGQVITKGPIKVHCWYDSEEADLLYTVSDSATGQVLSANNPITSGLADDDVAKLCEFDGSVGIVYFEGDTDTLRLLVIPVYDYTATLDSELVTNAHLYGVFDVTEYSANGCFLSWVDVNEDVRACTFNQAGLVLNNTLVKSGITPLAVAVAVDFTDFHIVVSTSSTMGVYTNTGGGRVAAHFGGSFSEELTTGISACAALTYIVDQTPDLEETARLHTVFAEFSTGAGTRYTQVQVFSQLGVAALGANFDTPSYTKGTLGLYSAAFELNGRPHVVAVHTSPLQNTYFLIDNAARIQAKFLDGIAEGVASRDDTGAILTRVFNQTVCCVFAEKMRLNLLHTDAQANQYAQFGLKEVTFNTDYTPAVVEFGASSYINSGLLWAYDGSTLHEQGFLVYPEGVTAAAGTVGNMAAEKSYSYRVYYEWTNARGERQRSTTSNVVTQALTGAEDSVTLTIPCLHLTYKGDNVSIVVYRTEGDPNVLGGAPFYRVTDSDPSASKYLANDTSVNTVEFIDVFSDSTIRVNELDYRNTGEIDNVAPLTSSVIGESKNRVWLAPTASKSMVIYSKLNSRGRDMLEFHDQNVLRLPEGNNEPITGFGAINFHTLIFKSNSIYAISGEGPNNLGGGFFNLPQIVSLDVGCITQASIVNIPNGVMFQSNKGIWIVGHNLDTQYIGADVEAFNNQNITSAKVVPEQNQVNFLTSEGRTLVYNYLLKAWSTFTNHEGVDSTLWSGVYTYLRNNGDIYRQGTSYSDAGVHYSMKFKTSALGIKGPQGKQKVKHLRILGTYYSPHLLRVTATYNHDVSSATPTTWNPEGEVSTSAYGESLYGVGPYGGEGDPVYQARFNLPRQKCQTVQFTVDTLNTGTSGRAVSVQALQIEVGVRIGGHEMSAGRSFSTGS